MHGRVDFYEKCKKFFAFQIEKTEKIICKKNGEKSFFTFYDKEKNFFESP